VQQGNSKTKPGVIRIIKEVNALLIKFKCPKCDVDNSYSLAEATYEGPYRGWKCRELFTIRVENNELKSCQPLTQEEFDRQREIEALKAKFKKQ